MALPYKDSGIYNNCPTPSSGGIDKQNGPFTLLTTLVFKIKFVMIITPFKTLWLVFTFVVL